MDADDKLDELKRTLNRQSLGPVGAISDKAASSLRTAVVSFTTWLRQAAYDQPLITLLLSFQAGYLVARLGRRYARQ